MRAQTNRFTVICKHHFNVDACDSWSEFAVIVDDVSDASEAAVEACKRLVKDNGGKASAALVIAGEPELSLPNYVIFDSEKDDFSYLVSSKVFSYRELN